MDIVFRSPGPSRAYERAVQPFWIATLGWLIASVASVAVAAAGMPVAGWAGNLANTAPVARLLPAIGTPGTPGPPARSGLNPRLSSRCQTCGVVELVRTLGATGTAPAAYELTVRLRDGSRRLSHSDNAAWRVGDSIMLIGGTRLAGRV